MSEMEWISEEELMSGLCRKEKKMYSYLYTKYSAVIFGTIYRIVKQKELAERVFQEFFHQLSDHLSTHCSPEQKLLVSLLHLARNCSFKAIGMQAVEHPVPLGTDFFVQVNQSQAAHHSPPFNYKLVDSVFFEGAHHVELASSLNIAPSAVKHELRVALNAFREPHVYTNAS